MLKQKKVPRLMHLQTRTEYFMLFIFMLQQGMVVCKEAFKLEEVFIVMVLSLEIYLKIPRLR